MQGKSSFGAMGAMLAVALLSCGAAWAEPTLAITARNARARQVSLAFSGIEDPLMLVAFKDTVDKGSDLTQWASATVLGTVDAGTTEQQLTLPEDYDFTANAVRLALMTVAPVEWIEDNDGAYLDLGVRPYVTHQFDMVFDTPETFSSLSLFDARKKAQVTVDGQTVKPRLSAWAYGSQHESHPQQLRIDGWGNSIYSKSKVFQGLQTYNLRVKISTSWAELNGTQVGFSSQIDSTRASKQGQSDRTLLLFAYRSQDDDAVTTSACPWRLRSFKRIGSGGYAEPLNDVIPCVRAGEAQAYDLAKDAFYTNVGSGSFSASASVVTSNCVARFVSCVSAGLAPAKVTVFRSRTGAVKLSFPAQDAKRLLYVAKAEASGWSSYCLLGEIEPGATEFSGTLLKDYIAEDGFVTFFLSEWKDESTRRVNPRKAAWAEGDGTCYLDLGFRPSSTNIIDMAFELTTLNETVNLFDARNATAQEARYTAMVYGPSAANHQLQLRVDVKGTDTWDDRFSSQKFATGQPYDLRVNFHGKTLLNDVDTGISALDKKYAITAKRTLLVMARRSEDTDATLTISSYRLSHFDLLWSADNPAPRCSVVPAILPDGSAQFYDLVSQTPIETQGSGSFVAGPDAGTGVVPVNDGIAGDIYVVSDPLPVGPSAKGVGGLIIVFQ